MIYRIRKEFIWVLALLIIGLIFYNTTVIREEQEWQRAQEIEMHYETIIKLDQLQKEVNELDKQIDEFIQKWNIEIFEGTAYAPFDNESGICADGDPGSTALGYVPGHGYYAVDFDVIPPHSEMWVQGEGLGVAADTGGLIKDRRVDIYRESYRKAMNYGRQRVIVVWPNY